MRIRKLKGKVHEIEIESHNRAYSDFGPRNDPDSSFKRNKQKHIVQGSNKEMVSVKHKSPKSKGKQVCSRSTKRSGSCIRKRTRLSDLYDNVEAQSLVMERAERVLSSLENELPHFLKCMLPSNVSHGFWLHLPRSFCHEHLPHCDASIVLVDEWGNEYKTSYLIVRHGLSAGWRGFSVAHRLLKGDVLIFHLIEPCKLKVHIVRVHGSDVIEAALCLMSFTASQTETDSDDLVKQDKRKRRKKIEFVGPFLPDISIPGPAAHPSRSDGDGFSPRLEGSQVNNQPQSNNICYPEPSFLRDHPREGVTCG